MKKPFVLLIFAFIAVFSVVFTACANTGSGDGSSISSEADSGGQEQAPEDPSPSSNGESDPIQSAAEHTDLTFSDENLGISFDLPEILKGHAKILSDQREAYGKTVDVISVYYMKQPNQADSDVHIFTIEIMDQDVWQQMQAEGGPLGSVLAESENGRVAVMNTLQSNPFAETDAEYDLFNQLPKELSVISESFHFLPQ